MSPVTACLLALLAAGFLVIEQDAQEIDSAPLAQCEGLENVCRSNCTLQTCEEYRYKREFAICQECRIQEWGSNCQMTCGCPPGMKIESYRSSPFARCVPLEQCGCVTPLGYMKVGYKFQKLFDGQPFLCTCLEGRRTSCMVDHAPQCDVTKLNGCEEDPYCSVVTERSNPDCKICKCGLS